MTGERRISPARVAVVLVLITVAGYLAVARWKALHPGAGAARVVGPRFDLTWPLRGKR
jgi:hypothetical protein